MARLVCFAWLSACTLSMAAGHIPREVIEKGFVRRRNYGWGMLPRGMRASELPQYFASRRPGGQRPPPRTPNLQQQQQLERSMLQGPMMTQAEQNKITSALQPHHSMAEWGSGGSTIAFSSLVGHYHSIEHSASFYKLLKDHLDLGPRLTYSLQEIREGHLGWRGRLQPGTFEQFRSYVAFIDSLQTRIGGGSSTFDRILVDGRARVACAVYALRHLAPDSIVFIHDFAKRVDSRQYKRVFDYYDQVDSVHSLVVLKPKPEFVGKAIPDNEIHELYSWYTGEEVPPGSRR